MKIRNIVLWYLATYGTALFLDERLALGFDTGETIVCAITCGLISVGLASGWYPSMPDDAPKWMRGRKY